MKILFKIICVLILAINSVNIFADNFYILDEKPLPNQLGTYFHSKVIPSDSMAKIDVYTAKIARNYHARLYLQPVVSQANAKFMGYIEPTEDFIVAINGGFYSPEFQPVGLMIDQGKRLKRFSKNRLLTSCVSVDVQGKMVLIPRCNQPPDGYYAMQAGPIIMDHGNLTGDIQALAARSHIPKSFFGPQPRTILAESSDKNLLVIVTSPMTLQQTESILKNNPKVFGVNKIESAINLDGGASTGMYVRFAIKPVYIQERKPVKVLVLFK